VVEGEGGGFADFCDYLWQQFCDSFDEGLCFQSLEVAFREL
jgi:hypothetical protein